MLRVEETRVVLLVIVRQFVFHFDSLERMLSIMNWKSVAFGLWRIIGKPKYFSKLLLILILRRVKIWVAISFGQFLEKMILDFVWLSLCPNKSQNIPSQRRIVLLDLSLTFFMSMRSLAKNGCESGRWGASII